MHTPQRCDASEHVRVPSLHGRSAKRIEFTPYPDDDNAALGFAHIECSMYMCVDIKRPFTHHEPKPRLPPVTAKPQPRKPPPPPLTTTLDVCGGSMGPLGSEHGIPVAACFAKGTQSRTIILHGRSLVWHCIVRQRFVHARCLSECVVELGRAE